MMGVPHEKQQGQNRRATVWLFVGGAAVVAGGAVGLFLARGPGSAQALKPAETPTISAAASPFVAVEQAKKAGAACLPALGEISRLSVDAAHTTVSLWNKEAPAQRTFTALNFLVYENQKVAPRALSFVAVTPTPGNHCDSSNLRVQPSSLSCAEISANLAKQNNPAPTPMGDILLYQPNAAGQRVILLPAATTGCIVISTGNYYGP
jgi:hypothetical protein